MFEITAAESWLFVYIQAPSSGLARLYRTEKNKKTGVFIYFVVRCVFSVCGMAAQFCLAERGSPGYFNACLSLL